MRSIASKIKELLFEQKMSQKELANITGMTESSISHYVKGDRVPRGTNLLRIAKALGTTTDYLLNENEKKDKEIDLKIIKKLIARNVETMTKEEKLELICILAKEWYLDG